MYKIICNVNNTNGDYMDILVIIFRTILFYLLITVFYRFMGKREVGQLSILDLIVSILIAELAAISIDNRDDSIFIAIIPMVILVIIQVTMAYISMKTSKVRDCFDGTPSVIINRGKINFKEMVRQRYNLDDLLSQLRNNHIRTIEEVDYAILESSGLLSVFRKKDNKFGDYPLPLILDGEIQKDTLVQISKDEKWIKNNLANSNLTIDNIFYAFYKENNLFIIRKDELDK